MTGSGTLLDPYVIWDVNDLQDMDLDLTAYYELGQDIDALATVGWNLGAGFIPIGVGGVGFTGQLDGKGFTISDLFINRNATYQALFGAIEGGAVLQNILMIGVDITSNDDYVAALVGYMEDGTVTDCSSTGTIDGDDYVGGLIGQMVAGTVSGCYSTCDVTALDDYAGGLIGYITAGAISECYATGDVVGDDFIGGFTGYTQAGATTIDDCYARGDATGDFGVGGFIGQNAGAVIDDCYSTGIPTGNFSVGGFCGDNGDTITNCFWDTETSGTAISDGGTGQTTAQMKTQSTFTDAGWDFTIPIWYITGSNDGYPSFTSTTPVVQTLPATEVT